MTPLTTIQGPDTEEEVCSHYRQVCDGLTSPNAHIQLHEISLGFNVNQHCSVQIESYKRDVKSCHLKLSNTNHMNG